MMKRGAKVIKNHTEIIEEGEIIAHETTGQISKIRKT